MQVDTVLERKLSVTHLDLQAAGRESETLARLEFLRPQSPPSSDTLSPIRGHLFQKGHTYSNKVTLATSQ